MALESVSHIDDLNSANPTATDPVSEGDDHVRNIKVALLADFPNITGAMTATQAELNVLDGVTAGTVTASKGLVVDSSSKLNTLNVDNIDLDGNTISITDSNGNLALTPNGTGAVVINGNIVTAETSALSGAGAIAVTAPIAEVTTTGASDAVTLADGVEGQHLFIIHVTDGGDADVTPSNFGNGTSFNLASAGDSVHLLFTNGAWYMMSTGFGDPVIT